MLDKLKDLVTKFQEVSPEDTSAFDYAGIIENIGNRFIYEDIMKEIIDCINKGDIKQYGETTVYEEEYYLFRVNGKSGNSLTILYRYKDTIDMLWIFGFPTKEPIVLGIEYEVIFNPYRISIYVDSEIGNGWDSRILNILPALFANVKIDTL